MSLLVGTRRVLLRTTASSGGGAVAPSNSVLPAVTGTSASLGVIFTTTNGTWLNSPTSFTYQWQADGVNISGETLSTYTGMAAELGKVITAIVTATNAAGSTPATSNSIGPLVLPKTVEDGSTGTFTSHYNAGYSVVTQSGGKVITATDLKALANLVDDGAGNGPAIMTNAAGVSFWRGNQASTILKNVADFAADNKGFTAIALIRFHRQIPGTNQSVICQGITGTAPNTGGGLSVVGSANGTSAINLNGLSAQTAALSAPTYYDYLAGSQMQVMGASSRVGTGATANTGMRFVMNGKRINTNNNVVASIGSITGFELFHRGQGAPQWGSFDLYELILVAGSPTDAQVDAIAANMMAAFGVPDVTNQIVAEGDSITDGTGTLTIGNTFGMWATEPGLRSSLPRTYRMIVWGGASNQTANLVTRRDTAASLAQAGGLIPGGRNFWATQIGVNDLSTGAKSATTCYGDIVSYAYTTAVAGAVGSILKKGWSYACMQNIGNNVTATNDKISILSPNLRGLETASFVTDCDGAPGGVYEGKVAVIPLHLSLGSGSQRFNTQAQVAAGLAIWFVDTTHPTGLLGERALATDPTYGYAAIPSYFP